LPDDLYRVEIIEPLDEYFAGALISNIAQGRGTFPPDCFCCAGIIEPRDECLAGSLISDIA